MAAPSYTDSGYSAPTSPPYSPSVTDGERILELRPSLSSLPADLPDHYSFQSQRIKLDLGARFWPTRTPCYGQASTIEGTVSVTTLDHVKRITIMVEGMVKASFMERGVLAGHIENTLFQRTITLYTSGSSSSFPCTYPFSITLPTVCDKSTSTLPPSFVSYLPGVSGEVRYRIRVDMSCSGLRRRETLVVPILYLPRTYTPATPRNAPLFNNQPALLLEDEGMEELSLSPKPLNKSTSKGKSGPSADVQAKISLPSPLIAASGDRIPFVITIYSRSPALAALYTDVTLQLIKVTKIKAYERASVKETILSAGEVYDIDQRGEGVQVLRGELGNGAPGTELSWSAAGVMEVKHLARLSIKPPPCTTALSANLPMFEGLIVVQVTTHRYSVNPEATAPALGLVGIAST